MFLRCFFVTELTALVTLILEDTRVSDVGVMEWANSAASGSVSPNLQHLNLSRTNVTHQIFSALEHLPRLTSLVLENTKVRRLFYLISPITISLACSCNFLLFLLLFFMTVVVYIVSGEQSVRRSSFAPVART